MEHLHRIAAWVITLYFSASQLPIMTSNFPAEHTEQIVNHENEIQYEKQRVYTTFCHCLQSPMLCAFFAIDQHEWRKKIKAIEQIIFKSKM